MTVTVVQNLAQPEFHQHCNMHTTSKTYQDCRMFGQEKASHNVKTGTQFIETSRETQTSDSWSAANITVRLVHSTVKTRTALKWISSDVCKRWLHEVCVSQPTSQDSFVCDVCIAQYS
ncbi:hypothetical protein DPMN_108272 [Dreissena polymorpha]|uniref:Uncharacterized protein n=1 Tax=Dreissena polymorpha TaxID=45954 RepID=A0A9D4K8I9_DREPO|nr:hypothetical protein DPMN_108272 [Dreissena polymorpha]